MAKNKVQRSFRLPPDVASAVEEYAKEQGITKSEAYRRVIKQGIEVTESDVTVVYGQEKEKLPDGGQMDAIDNRLEKIDDEIELLTDGPSEVESFVSQLRSMMLPFTFSILWIGIEVAYGFPFEPFVTAATGIPLIAWLVYPQLREMND